MKHALKPALVAVAVLSMLYTACTSTEKNKPAVDTAAEKKQINAMLDSFNMAAANADYKTYFDFYTEDAIFTGTDATERWDKKAFMIWAKPFFDRGKAWAFTTLERNIYFDNTGTLAWFDELLNTQMKICRGSGVVVKEGDVWKVKQYILSTTVPNDKLDSVIVMKAQQEDSIINKLGPGNKETQTPKQPEQVDIDPVKVSPGIFKVLMENDKARVVQYSLRPGEKDDWHTHPGKVSYVVSGGKLRVKMENGGAIAVDEKTGTASWMDHIGKHYVENIGTTTVVIVYTELK